MSKAALGADPEFFLTASNGIDIIPSCDLVGGSKDEPLLYSKNKGYSWLEDNVAVELNYPPSTETGQFVNRTIDALAVAKMRLNKMGYNIKVSPHHTFRKDQLTHPKALTIGCSPDTCAYDNNKKRVVDVQSLGTTRFCGGHLHLSYDKKERIPAFAAAMMMDILVGLPSIVWDKQGPRRPLYGLAGLYREKPYGIEYRTMSNWWLTNNMTSYLAASALSLANAIEQKPVELADLFSIIPFKDAQTAINNEDHQAAYQVYRFVRRHKYWNPSGLNSAFSDYSF